MASAVGLCVAFVSGLSASHKRKGRRAPGFSILFYIHTRSHEAEKTVRHRKAARSVARPTSLPASDGHSPLSHHARWWKKMAPCHEPRSEARRRRRRRDTTKPTTHTNDSPSRSSCRIKRRPDPTSTSREPERATAVPSFISHPRRAVHGPTKFLSSM